MYISRVLKGMMKIFNIQTIVLCALILLGIHGPLWAGVDNTVLTPANPTTLSNGKSYYLSGMRYTFRVQAVDVAATAWADWGTITLSFNGGSQSVVIDIPTAAENSATGVTTNAATNNSAVVTSIDFDIELDFLWTATPYNAVARNITATVTSSTGAPISNVDIQTFSFGVCSEIRVLNFQQNGVAADARVNEYHNNFTVTGDVVYSVTAETITDEIETIDPGEITTTELRYDGGATGLTDATAADLSFTVTNATTGLGDHTWQVQCTMTTGGTLKNSIAANALSINVNNVEITNIEFTTGTGVGPIGATPYYYRSVSLPTTQIRVTAQLQDNSPSLGGDRSMRGATTIRVTDGTNTYNVVINDGQTIGTGTILTPPAVGAGNTVVYTYQVDQATGSAYDNEQDTVGEIVQAVNPEIYWDNNDPPGNNGSQFTGFTSVVPAPGSFTLNWGALSHPSDGDHYTWRIYYRLVGASSWTIIDRFVANYGAGQTYDLTLLATTSATITNLQPITQYEYEIAAVDAFGQEVVQADRITGTVTTQPEQTIVSISDGITQYDDASFTADGPVDPATPTPSNRVLRDSAIRVNVFIANPLGQPDSANIIVGDFAVGGDLVTGSVVNGVEGTDYYRIALSKVGPNTWVGHIPSENPVIAVGTEVRFILESIKNGTPTYTDHDSDYDTVNEAITGDPNDFEWTFAITQQPNFTPWPTRVLNNVITKKNPRAYPSYYLTADAYVTIIVYDIKGRKIATLLERAVRPAGQNIKEQGWAGTNKARKKLGPGIYYMQFKATRQSDGKVILNKFKKVVVAR